MSSAYRDRGLRCPQCPGEMVRQGTRDVWQCAKCRGVFAGVADVIEQLLRVAPDLLPEAGVRSIVTPVRDVEPREMACPTCGAKFTPVTLGGVELDRCYSDETIWFDANEHEEVVATAAAQHRERTRSWIGRYLHDLFAP